MRISVCVPTYRRPEPLARALDHLLALDSPDGGYEVVVVDDASPPGDGVADLLAERARRSSVPLRWQSHDRNAGPGAARNTALKLASGDWIAFTDDDCRPGRDWLLRLLEAAEGSGADVVVGLTKPDPERVHLLAEPFSRTVSVPALDEFYRTCNIAYRHDLLDRLGGFDPRFHLAGEDTDLGWRAVAAGASVAFAPAAVVIHDVTVVDWRADLRGRRRWADGPAVVARHPGTRRLIWKPYIFRPAHVPILAGLASLPLAIPRVTRRPYLLAAAAAVGFDAARRGSADRALKQLQLRLNDLYEVLLLLRSSARERTLLL